MLNKAVLFRTWRHPIIHCVEKYKRVEQPSAYGYKGAPMSELKGAVKLTSYPYQFQNIHRWESKVSPLLLIVGCDLTRIQSALLVFNLLPDTLLHEAIRVLRCEGGQHGLRRLSLFQFNEFGVGIKVRALIDVQHSYGDGGGGLTGRVDASG